MNKELKILDLYCGAGGFSLGFEQAGFKVKYAIDNSKLVQETFEYNHPNTEFILNDIREQDPKDFKNINIIIGSPPCTEFSIANNNPQLNKGLELVKEYFRFIKEINPEFWIMENVPQISKHLTNIDFSIPITKIFNCANYGIPQKRKRCFAGNYIFPIASHSKNPHYSFFGDKQENWMTTWDAISDIIFIEPNQDNFPNHNNYNFNQEKNNPKYLGKFQGLKILNLNEPSYTITDNHGNTNLIPNHNYFELSQVRNPLNSGGNSNFYKSNEPARTITTIPHKIMASNLMQYRRLTVRECARLQSFPDEFIFFGSLTSQYKMVGNAVPPLMAYKLALAINNKKEAKS